MSISTSDNFQIRFGNFGLVFPPRREGHHSALGTSYYITPEQWKGICDQESALHSLEKVLLEFMVPMQTPMERSKMIAAIKKGQTPTALYSTSPQRCKKYQRNIPRRLC